jgi:CheY-like chemotaxis protein
MQSLKIDFLIKYNSIISLALNSSPELPDNLCEFLVSEYDLWAVALFKLDSTNKFVLLGKSDEAKKSLTNNSQYECPDCLEAINKTNGVYFNLPSGCKIQISEIVLNEGCLYVNFPGELSVMLKIAKKTPFSNVDKDNMQTIGDSVRNILKIWHGDKKSDSKSVSKIISEIAHELRTPTNSIMGFASLLNENNLTSSQAEYVSTLKDNAFNLLVLINDIIDIAKLEAGVSKVSYSNIKIKPFLEEIIKLFSDKVKPDVTEFLLNIDNSVPENIKIDSQKLRYIIINILSSSLQMTERGKISITVSVPLKNKLNFKITDSSSGISSNKLKEIFKPFAMSELGLKKTSSSSGLGLILTKKYIEILGGNIEILSSMGRGITYDFTVSSEVLSSIESQISNLPAPGKKNKVLVVEDDYATSKLLSNYLNKWGYEPVIVNSAGQALKEIDKENFLAVLMDIVLPDANGFELLKLIREHKNAKNTPVIVCSVEAEQQKAFLMGAVEYFVKPIKYKYLVEVLTSYKLKRDSNILIVDDDVPTLNLIKEAVEQAGYNAIAESHSSKVMEMIESLNLDIAIIDLDMPEVTGFDLIKLIKSKPKFAKLPVIIYTGKENYKEELEKINGMFTELLEKSSTNIEDLSETINQMINSYDEPTPIEEVEQQQDTVKILLVEDYKHSQIIVTRLLKKNNFDSIVVVENGAEAVEAVKKQKFNLILMDMQMPVMNGFEATEKIRQLPDYKETPIIALTAFAMKGDREKCLEAGATDYIPKPIDSKEFIEKVKYYTESKVRV